MSFSVVREDGSRGPVLPDTTTKPWASVVGKKGDDPAFWESERRRLLDAAGDLGGLQLQMNRILVAVWTRPETTAGGIIMLEAVKEDRVQGVAGIVLAYGPSAYVSDDMMTFAEDERPPLHSWVVFRKSDGFRVPIRAAQCVVLDSEKSIRAVVSRPDIVTEG